MFFFSLHVKITTKYQLAFVISCFSYSNSLLTGLPASNVVHSLPCYQHDLPKVQIWVCHLSFFQMFPYAFRINSKFSAYYSAVPMILLLPASLIYIICVLSPPLFSQLEEFPCPSFLGQSLFTLKLRSHLGISFLTLPLLPIA